MAQITDITQNLIDVTNDLNDIKGAMQYVGVEVGTKPVNQYADKIKGLKPELDKVPTLEAQITTDDNNFSGVYDAIVAKGQTPTKNDRSTYAPAIGAIVTVGKYQEKTVDPAATSLVVTTDTGYDALSKVTVNAAALQTKTVDPTSSAFDVVPNTGYIGLSKVTVNAGSGGGAPGNYQEKTVNPAATSLVVKPDAEYYALSKVTVNAAALQTKTVDPATTSLVVYPDTGYIGLNQVNVNAAALQTKTVNPSSSAFDVTPDTGYVGLSKVTVNAEAGETCQEKTVNPASSTFDVTPDAEYYALSKVTVNAAALQTKTVNPTSSAFDVVPDTGYIGLSKVTVNAGSGSGGGAAITDASYLFYNGARFNLFDEFFSRCIGTTNWNNAFASCTINRDITVDMTSVTSNNNTRMFSEYSGVSADDTTITVLTNNIAVSIFQNLGLYNTNKLIKLALNISGMPSSLDSLFNCASEIKEITINGDLSSVTNINYMMNKFNYNNKQGQIVNLDLSFLTNNGLNWSNITQSIGFLQESIYLQSITFDDFTGFSNCRLDNFLVYCRNITSINFGNSIPEFLNCNTNSAFKGLNKLTSISLDITDNASYAYTAGHTNTFQNMTLLQQILSSKTWILRSNAEFMFYNCAALVTIPSIEFHVVGTSRNSIGHMFEKTKAETINISIVYDVSGHNLVCGSAFSECTNLKHITGNLDLSCCNNDSYTFNKCTSLETIETTGSFAGLNTDSSRTLDLSASPVFNIASYINSLASNDSGKTRIIKLHATVYSGLTSETTTMAAAKNYTLSS